MQEDAVEIYNRLTPSWLTPISPGTRGKYLAPLEEGFEGCPETLTHWNSRPRESLTPAFQYKLAEEPDKTVVGVIVEYEPGASTPPHRHGTANVIGHVIEGEVLCAMNDGPAKVYKVGESWYEAPGCFHRISDNNSSVHKLKFLAIFHISTEILEREGFGVLLTVDPAYA